MSIETFTVCYNEELMLPYFLRHYLQYGSVTIFDNYSTDNSVKIAQEAGATVIPFGTDGKYREDILMNLRNMCWKESKADWVIVVDIDEFVYHPKLLTALEKSKGTVIMPRMFEMFAEECPHEEGQIYDLVKMGVELRSKMCLFKPSEIKEMNYEPGNHFAFPEGNFVLDVTTNIIFLHYKYLGVEYISKRYKELYSRQSKENIARGWGWHMAKTKAEWEQEIIDMKRRLLRVIK